MFLVLLACSWALALSNNSSFAEFEFKNESVCANNTEMCEPFEETTIFTDSTEKTTESEKVTSTFPPTQSSPTLAKKHTQTDLCSCDISSICSINCCCDPDCTDSDRIVFSHCITEEKVATGLCYSDKFVYRNNTRYHVIQSEKGLFCIARDNFPDRFSFVNQKAIQSLTRFNKLWKRRRHFTWIATHSRETQEEFSFSQIYKFGSPIWKFSNSTFQPLEIPSSPQIRFCRGKRVIRFLEDLNVKCFIKTPLSKTECENKGFDSREYCGHVSLVAQPTFLNQTRIEDSPDEAVVNLQKLLCNDTTCEEIDSLPAPVFNTTCLNAVSSIEYIFIHNGSKGLIEAQCRLQLNLKEPISSQTVQVKFAWARNESKFRRSGSPGYLHGKPIITGTAAGSVNFSEDSKDWLSLPRTNSRGQCSGRANILFRDNVRTQCYLTFNSSVFSTESTCLRFKDQIWAALLGPVKINTTDPTQLLTFVSSYGNPTSDDTKDWVPIYLDKPLLPQRPCSNFIFEAHHRILYSHFGPFSRPQSKIVGATLSLNQKAVRCQSTCQMKIMSSVSFIDISEGAVNKFAKAPVLKIRLPKDFFYPFTSYSGDSGLTPSSILFVALVLSWP